MKPLEHSLKNICNLTPKSSTNKKANTGPLLCMSIVTQNILGNILLYVFSQRQLYCMLKENPVVFILCQALFLGVFRKLKVGSEKNQAQSWAKNSRYWSQLKILSKKVKEN